MENFEIAWRPDPQRAAASHTSLFMAEHGISTFSELAHRSATDPEWFWPAVIDYIGLPFNPRWTTVRDTSRGHPWATWFQGSAINVSEACVDRWASETPDRVAVRSQKESGAHPRTHIW